MASVNKQQREAAARLKRYEARQQLNATQNKRRVRDNVIAVASVVVVATLAGFAQFIYFDSGPGARRASFRGRSRVRVSRETQACIRTQALLCGLPTIGSMLQLCFT